MNQILYILRRRLLVPEIASHRAEMEAHIHDMSLGTNTQEDNILFVPQLFAVGQENRVGIKLEKGEFMREGME